jgi:splicing factor 45
MDVDAELAGPEGGGLMQEIGEECSEKVIIMLSLLYPQY